jgi:hypothetical protein
MMIKRLLLIVGLIGASAFPLPLAAQAYPVDDSASQVLESGLIKMRWDSLVPRPGQASTMTGRVIVIVRLDVSQWKGRQARIYQKLPAQPAGPVNVRWTSKGTLQPGILRDGERALVYAGPINSDRMEDTFQLTIQADGDRVVRPLSLAFSFEIELEPTP